MHLRCKVIKVRKKPFAPRMCKKKKSKRHEDAKCCSSHQRSSAISWLVLIQKNSNSKIRCFSQANIRHLGENTQKNILFMQINCTHIQKKHAPGF